MARFRCSQQVSPQRERMQAENVGSSVVRVKSRMFLIIIFLLFFFFHVTFKLFVIKLRFTSDYEFSS